VKKGDGAIIEIKNALVNLKTQRGKESRKEKRLAAEWSRKDSGVWGEGQITGLHLETTSADESSKGKRKKVLSWETGRASEPRQKAVGQTPQAKTFGTYREKQGIAKRKLEKKVPVLRGQDAQPFEMTKVENEGNARSPHEGVTFQEIDAHIKSKKNRGGRGVILKN